MKLTLTRIDTLARIIHDLVDNPFWGDKSFVYQNRGGVPRVVLIVLCPAGIQGL